MTLSRVWRGFHAAKGAIGRLKVPVVRARNAIEIQPLMVAATGRSGTTTMMQLLGSAPEVVFDREYAYENAYLSYFLALSRVPLEGARTSDVWRRAAIDVDNFIERKGVVGGFPWAPTPSIEVGGDGLADELFTACWDVYAKRAGVYARELGGPATVAKYYAETAPLWIADRVKEVLGGRTIILVRDPRDQYLSIMSFNAKRGRLSFGVQPGDTPQSYALKFVERQRPYLERAIAPGNPDREAVVRFDDLTENREATAERLSEWLEVPLSTRVEIDHHQEHGTSAASEGPRWKTEMAPDVLEIFDQHLHKYFEALGWEWD